MLKGIGYGWLNAQTPSERGAEVNTNPNDAKPRLATAEDSKPTAKKPYVKPEVRHERVFETAALTCGKINHTHGNCYGANRRTS